MSLKRLLVTSLGKLILVSLVLGMSACQTAFQRPVIGDAVDAKWLSEPSVFETGLQRYQQMPRWRYSAKVGIKTPKVQQQANLVWQFADQSNDVRIFGPLGVGAIKLEFDQYGVQLSDNQGILHRGLSAEDLLTRVVGWPIPIDALSYWLFGLPLPGQAFEYQQDELDDIKRLRQLGWTIQYSGYQDYGGQRLARKLSATKRVKQDQLISVKLITKNWQWP